MVELGSFSFRVEGDTSPAIRSLDQLAQRAQQIGQQVQGSLGRMQAQPLLLNADGTPLLNAVKQAEASVQKLGQAVRQVTDRPAVLTIRSNLNEAEQSLSHLVKDARALGDTKLNLTANVGNVKNAQQAIGQLSEALRTARAGETINVQVRADSVEHANQTLRQLNASIEAAKQAGARVNVNVATNSQGASGLGQFGQGFIAQITPGLTTGAAAAAGVIVAQQLQKVASAFVDATQAGIAYNAMLETSATQLKVFIGSAEGADQALQQLRKNADITPFDTEEVVRSGAVFAQVANGSIERMQRLVDLAEQLAAVNPNPKLGGGLEGATIAIREALSGDFTSIRERFNVSASEIQRIKDLGLAGEQLAAQLVKAAGGSKQLVEALGQTFEGRLSTAKANLDNITAAATKPIFDLLAAGLGKFNDVVTAGIPAYQRIEAFLDRLEKAGGKGAAALAVIANPIGTIATALTVPAPPPQTGASDTEKAREASAQAVNRALDEQDRKLARQKSRLEEIKTEHQAIQALVEAVKQSYEEQLVPLEQQKRALDEQQRKLTERQVNLDQQKRDNNLPVADRAAIAASDAQLQHEKELLDIKHRRAELSESIAQAEERAAERVAEKEIAAQERALQALQQRVQAENQARQVALEALQEEIRKRQEARQIALEALSEIIRARQEERQAALDALREEIQGRQQARREALDGLREQIDARRRAYDEEHQFQQDARQDARDAFAEQERLADRAHAARMQQYADQIQALQDQLDVQRKQSDAERELAEFNRAESARQRAQSIAEAERAVRQARTGRERSDALQRLHDIQAQAAADAKREEIQARIDKQKEEDDKRRQAIQDKINELQRKAQAEDRAYQRDKDARAEAEHQKERAEDLAARQEERAERARRAAEDAQVRAAEKADKEATKAEEAQIRAAEKQAREEDKADQAALRAAQAAARAEDRADQEKLRAQQQKDREADRAAQQQILDLQNKILAARNNLTDRQQGFQDVIDKAALDRLREQADLEKRILDNRERAVEGQDPKKLGQIAFSQTFLDELQAILDGKQKIVEGKIAAIKDAEANAIAGLQLELTSLDIQTKFMELGIEQLEKRRDALKKDLDRLKNDLDSPAGHGVQQVPQTPATPPSGPSQPPPIPGSGGTLPVSAAPAAGETGLAHLISEWGPEFLRTGEWLANKIWEGIGKGLTASGSAPSPPPGAIVGVATILTSVFQQGTQQATDQADPGGQAADAVSDGLQAAQQALGQQLADVLNGAWAQAVPVADAIPVEIGNHLAAIPDLSGLIGGIGQSLTDALNGAWAQAVPTADAIPVEIANHLAVLPDGFADIVGAPLGQGLTDAANAAWAAAVPVVDDIPVQITAHLADPGPDLRQFGSDFGDRLTEAANAAWAQAAPTVDDIPVGIANHLETAITQQGATFQREGGEIAGYLSDGWVQYDWATMAQSGMNAVKVKLNEIAPSFEGFGRGAATYWQNGWVSAMNSWTPPVPTAPTGGGGGGGRPGSPPSPGPTQPPTGGPNPGGGVISQPPDGHGNCPNGWALYGDGANHFICVAPGSPRPGPPWFRVYYRAPSSLSRQASASVGADPFASTLRPAGFVLPPSLSLATRGGGTATSASPTLTVAGGTRPNLTVQVNVSGTGLDVNQLASAIQRQTVAAVVDIFDTYERTAPNPVSRLLPGAQR